MRHATYLDQNQAAGTHKERRAGKRSMSRRGARAFDETFGERWRRRLITGPALLALTPAYLAALPATITVAAASDLIRRQPWTASRFAAALGANLALHVAGFAGLFGAWLAGGRWAGASPEREHRLEQRLQVTWSRWSWRASARIFGMRLVVEGHECVEPGPVLILSRHASLIDTLLPLVLIAGPHQLRLRYVMKRELLWDPIIDALGHRWPTAFIRRGTRDPRELGYVRHLLDDLGARDAVVLFPEGTRFSKEKQARILASLRQSHPDAYQRAARLRHVLPPRPSGLVSLLGEAAAPDVLVFAHTGLEGASHFKDLLGGALVGRTVHVKMWRVPRADVPAARDEQVTWLQDLWEQVDQWIDTQRS